MYRIANPSFRSDTDVGQWYISENVVEGNRDISENNWNGGVQTEIAVDKVKLESPWPFMFIQQHTVTTRIRR